MSLSFKHARPSDLDKIEEIINNAKEALKERGVNQWQAGYPNRSTLEDDLKNNELYVLEDKEEIVACLVLSYKDEANYDEIEGAWLTKSNAIQPSYATIHRCATDLSHTQKGYMKTAFTEAKKLAQKEGLTSIRIDTHQDNIPMQKLLSSLGYTSCGKILLKNATPKDDPKRIAYELLL